MSSIRNEAGMLNAQYGMYDGKKYLFTHRNPSTGEVWCEDIPVNEKAPGRWLPMDKVTFI